MQYFTASFHWASPETIWSPTEEARLPLWKTLFYFISIRYTQYLMLVKYIPILFKKKEEGTAQLVDTISGYVHYNHIGNFHGYILPGTLY